MDEAAEVVEGSDGQWVLLLADHASNHVPPDMELGIAPALLDQHIAVDVGVDSLTRALAARLDCPAVIARVSRLVVDLNRDPDEPAAIPTVSDGQTIPGNYGLDPDRCRARIARFWEPYHARVAAMIVARAPHLLVSLHSFTPQLASRPEETRPWEVGLLYNRDDRAARLAIAILRGQKVATGDNQPYSGRTLNATMNRHAERRGLPYLGIEVRQDLIADAAGAARWAERLAALIVEVRDALPAAGQSIRSGA